MVRGRAGHIHCLYTGPLHSSLLPELLIQLGMLGPPVTTIQGTIYKNSPQMKFELRSYAYQTGSEGQDEH